MDSVHLFLNDTVGKINKDIYGFFVEHTGELNEGGIYVGEDSDTPNVNGLRAELIEKCREMKVPLLRWGGCTNEMYDWRDGIGPKDERPVSMGASYLHSGKVQHNEFGTHEFCELCDLIGADKYITLNVAGAAPLDAFHWMEYCNTPRGLTDLSRLREKNGHPEPFGIKYWGIGNENNEYGGLMTPEEYCAVYARVTSLALTLIADKKVIASGPTWGVPDASRRFFKSMANRGIGWGAKHLDGFSLHCYTVSDGADTDFSGDQWYQCMREAKIMDRVIQNHVDILNEFDPKKKVRLYVDEWGNWTAFHSGESYLDKPVFKQLGTVREAVHAALTLNIFNNNCDYVEACCLTGLINYIHAPFLSYGSQLIETPTWDVFRMMAGHQDAECIRTVVACEQSHGVDRVSASASCRDGKVLITLVNLEYDKETEVTVDLHGADFGGQVTAEILASADPHDRNTPEQPDKVRAVTKQMTAAGDSLTVTLPAASVVSLRFETELPERRPVERIPAYSEIKKRETHYADADNLWN